jgi:hypothetical protein
VAKSLAQCREINIVFFGRVAHPDFVFVIRRNKNENLQERRQAAYSGRSSGRHFSFSARGSLEHELLGYAEVENSP